MSSLGFPVTVHGLDFRVKSIDKCMYIYIYIERERETTGLPNTTSIYI